MVLERKPFLRQDVKYLRVEAPLPEATVDIFEGHRDTA